MNDYWIFLTSAFILGITPGPAIFYVLMRSIKGGRKDGYMSICGTTTGDLFHVLFAALGISSILAMSSIAFAIIKYAGASYLIYLGIRIIFSKNTDTSNINTNIFISTSPFKQGIITEVLNPKTALFFLSFIPQFINPNQPVFIQFLILGGVVVIMNTAVNIFVATFSSELKSIIQSKTKIQKGFQMIPGFGLVSLGFYIAFSGESK